MKIKHFHEVCVRVVHPFSRKSGKLSDKTRSRGRASPVSDENIERERESKINRNHEEMKHKLKLFTYSRSAIDVQWLSGSLSRFHTTCLGSIPEQGKVDSASDPFTSNQITANQLFPKKKFQLRKHQEEAKFSDTSQTSPLTNSREVHCSMNNSNFVTSPSQTIRNAMEGCLQPICPKMHRKAPNRFRHI
ncbi:hypothetical protein TNCV_4592631 [Trichonephila clavipes]|nr:hypothetical protein TNCV_4592631 [Trichonephila clavipes]